MDSVSFSNFRGTSGDGSILLEWNMDYTETITKLLVNHSDKNIDDSSTQHTVGEIDLLSALVDGNSYKYTLDGLLNGGINGIGYMVSLEATIEKIVNGETVIEIFNSDTISVVPSGIPSQPNFFTLGQAEVGSFYVSLSEDEGGNNKYMSVHDGYSRLKGVYVTYHNDINIKTKYFSNDENNSLYTRRLTVSNLLNRKYEVTIRLVNSNGMSQVSMSKNIEVTIPIPSAVTNVRATPTMFLDENFDFSTVSHTVEWDAPTILGDPSLNKFKIFRNNVEVATINAYDNNGNMVLKYVDNGLTAGMSYVYKINSLSNAITDLVLPRESLSSSPKYAIDKPSAPVISKVIPSGNRQFQINVNNNLNGIDNHGGFVFDYDLSGNNGIGFKNLLSDIDSPQSRFTVDGLDNGKTYSVLLRLTAKITHNGRYLNFSSEFSNTIQATPYGSLAVPTNFIVKNVDPSGNPLNGRLNLEWKDPVNVAYGSNPSFSVSIDRKFLDAPDASYSTLGEINNNVESYLDTNVSNGKSYTYRIRQKVMNSEDGALYSNSTSGTSIPFNSPSAPTGLLFSNETLAYSFSKGLSSGGLPIAGHLLTLSNVSNGVTIDVTNIEIGVDDTSGNLLDRVLPGRKYSLTVKAYVLNGVTKVYSSASNTAFAFSKPEKLPVAPTVTNVDSNNLPLDGKLNISWSLPIGYDASNITYALYREGGVFPITGAESLSTTSFQNVNLNNGGSYAYQVKIILGSVELGTVESELSNASPLVKVFGMVDNVTEINYTFENPSAVLLTWRTPTSLLIKGLNANELRYRVVDSSNTVLADDLPNNQTNVVNILGFTPGLIRNLYVLSGVEMTNGIKVYNTKSEFNKKQVATYERPSAPTDVTVQPSSNSCLVDCKDYANVPGLVFDSYKYQYKLATANDFLPPAIFQSQSLFYVTGLVNNSEYTIKLSLLYKDALGNDVDSPSVSNNFTPKIAPDPVTDFNLTAESSGALTLKWAVDNGSNAASHYSVFRDGEVIFSHLRASSTNSLLKLDKNDNTKWTIVDSSTVAGKLYKYEIVSEYFTSDTIYVSSQAVNRSGAAYAPPSNVRELNYEEGDNIVTINWTEPSSFSGASFNGNGPLMYEVTVLNPDRNGYKFVDRINTNQYILSGSFMTNLDASYAGMNITNMKLYNVFIKPYFAVESNQNNLSIGQAESIVVQPRPNLMKPVLTVEAVDTDADGKKCRIKIEIDASSNLPDVKFEMSRTIYNDSGLALATILDQRIFPQFDSSFSSVVYDSATDSGIGMPSDSANYLNGNHIEYTLKMTHNNWTINKSKIIYSDSKSAIIKGKPAIEYFNVDSSGNVDIRLNKNGAIVNSLDVMGFGYSRTEKTFKVQVKNVPLGSLLFNNEQINSVKAKNQVATLKLSRDEWDNQVTQALAIFATETGTVLLDSPVGSFI